MPYDGIVYLTMAAKRCKGSLRQSGAKRGGDIFSAIGAATGLGNAMRFPGLCARYGVAFVAAYALCLALVCLPLLVAEMSVGAKFRSPLSGCIGRLSPRAGFLAWAAVANSAFIGLYYGGVMLGTGNAALAAAGAEGSFPQSVALSAVVWAAVFALLSGGSARLSRSGRLSLCSFLIAILPIAVVGFGNIKVAFSPLSLLSGAVWTDALCQAMLSLSLAAGVMPAFAAEMSAEVSPARCAAKIVGANFTVCLIAYAAVMPYGVIGGNGDGLSASGELFPRIFAAVYGEGASGKAFSFIAFAALLVVAVQSACSLIFPLVREHGGALPAVCAVGFIISLFLAADGDMVAACDFVACTVAAPLIAAGECLLFARTGRQFMADGAASFLVRYICPAACALAAVFSLCCARISGLGVASLAVAVVAEAALMSLKLFPPLTKRLFGGKMVVWKRLKACATHFRAGVLRHTRSQTAGRRSNS